jgi:hypothetical protein
MARSMFQLYEEGGRPQPTQCVQVLLGLCSLKIQDVNYFHNFTLFIQNRHAVA